MRARQAAYLVIACAMVVEASSSAAAAPRAYTIVIDKMKYGPVPPILHKGDQITWSNRDFLRHTASAADHSFDVDLPPGANVKIVLRKSGSVAFACRYHPGMRGVLEVK